MVTASSILGVPKRPAKPSDVLRPVDLDALAERVAALSVRASGYKLGVKVAPPVKASGTTAGAHLGWDHRHEWQPAHPEGDPAGLPSGKIKHAVLVIGGKRYKGPSHFQALMQHARTTEDKRLDESAIQHEGFETESGHFLDREQAGKYVGFKSGRLTSEEASERGYHLTAVDGKLYTQDAVQARDLTQPAPQLSTDVRSGADQLHRDAVRKALAVAEANALANADEVDDAKAKKRREEAAALALLLLGAAGAASYVSLLPLLLRQAVASAPSVPAQEPAAVLPVSLPTGEPATEPTATVPPAEPEPSLPTPEQETDALGGKTLEQAAEDFADSRAEFLKPFCADIQEAMRLEVEVGKANGESIHQIGRRLFDLANGIGGSRGAVLAAAEAQSAYGHAQLRALVAAGYRKANWVQVDRPTKRDSHAENAAVGPLRLGDTWPNGQKFPGDPIGGPAENCNCLCMLVGADWHKPKPERVLTRRQKLRKERLAKKQAAKASDQTPSEAVKAALPKFGCLMAMLPELAAGLASVASQIPKEDLAEDGVETEPHATVLYGFSLDFDAQKLPEVLSGFGPFEARLGKLSRFECPEYDVVKFEVVSDRLRALNAKLAESFKGDITPSKWDYNPHVTVAYVKKGAAQDLDGSKLEGRTFEVRDLLYSLPEKQGRVEFVLGETAKASAQSPFDAVQAVLVKEHESHSKTGQAFEVREHEDKRTKQAAAVPMSHVGDKAKELAAGVTWTHGQQEKASAESAKSDKSEKAQRAKAAHHLIDRKVQRYAEEHNEPAFAKAIGGASFRDNEAIDVVVADDTGRVAHGIELKTVVSNKAQKITMKGEAIARKRSWERKNKATIHTVVLDDTLVFNAKGNGKHDEEKRKIYYRRGYGSFRMASMYQVKDLDELKTLMSTPKRALPKGAK